MRPATKLVERARSFKSSIFLKAGQQVADARSIMAILLLSASVGTVIHLEVCGEDEEPALAAIVSVFESADSEAIERDELPENSEEQKSIT